MKFPLFLIVMFVQMVSTTIIQMESGRFFTSGKADSSYLSIEYASSFSVPDRYAESKRNVIS